MFYTGDSKDYFDKNYRNQKTPSTKGTPDPNFVANSLNTGNGAFNSTVPKYCPEKRRRKDSKKY